MPKLRELLHDPPRDMLKNRRTLQSTLINAFWHMQNRSIFGFKKFFLSLEKAIGKIVKVPDCYQFISNRRMIVILHIMEPINGRTVQILISDFRFHDNCTNMNQVSPDTQSSDTL